MSDEPLSRLHTTQTNCGNEGCRKIFTVERRGMVCSGCHSKKYCDQQCQRAGWPSHKADCRKFQQYTKEQRWKPNIAQDLSHFGGMIGHTILVASRSALKLGRPDSLARTHFLHISLDYRTPPRSRWGLTNAKPVGDEADFFTFREFHVRPDSWLDGDHDIFEGSSERKRKLLEATKVRPGETAFHVGISADADQVVGGRGVVSLTIVSPDRPRNYSLSYAQRQLNPTWEMLFPIAMDLLPKTKDEQQTLTYLVECIDFAMSESLEVLNSMPHKPHLGSWRDICLMVEGSRRKLSKVPLDEDTDVD